MPLRIISAAANQKIFALPPTATAFEAAQLMTNKSIGSVMIIDETNGTLVGLFTERDLMTRVVNVGLDPKTTPLNKVMTNELVTVAPDVSVYDAMSLMRNYHCRHLPLLENGMPVGMVSVRDLYSTVIKSLEADVQEKEAYISSGGY